MAIELGDARGVSDEVMRALRLRALRGIECGFSQAAVAELLGVTADTVSRWWVAYVAGGVDALPADRTGRPVGTGRTLSEEQAEHLQQLIDTKSPADLEIAAPLWNRRAVRDLILKEYGLRVPIRTVGEYLRRWGYTAKKPTRHSHKQDPDEVAQWLERIYPDIEKQAQAEGATIIWCDEMGVAADEYPGYGYAREGQRATIEVPDPHVRMNVISGITNDGQLRFMTYAQTMTAERFIVFLKHLLASVPGTLFVIVDGLRAHEKDGVVKWVAEHEDRLAVFYLPRYSPELNPTEYLNNDIKGQVNDDGLPENRNTLRSRLQRFLHRLIKLPQHVINYFLHPRLHYCASDQRETSLPR